MTSKQEELINSFSKISSWEDRYNHIIALGRQLSPMPEELKTEDLKIKGCQSQVWLHARQSEDGKIYFQADSDALIVKGLIAMLLTIYSGQSAKDILSIEPLFIEKIGLGSHLSPSRANGLVAMIKQIKFYALAFNSLSK